MEHHDKERTRFVQLLLEFGRHKAQCAFLYGSRCNCGFFQTLKDMGHIDSDFDEDAWG